MTLIVVGLALLAATLTIGIRRVRYAYQRELDARRHLEDPAVTDEWEAAKDPTPPPWVNHGGSFYREFVEAVHFAQWEQQLEDR